MNADLKSAIKAASSKCPKPSGEKFQYGTAGFRMNADLLDSVVFRVGLLASLRSRKRNGDTIGIMITASHNPAVDNGVKIVDPMGDMLESSWEAYATQLANAETQDDLLSQYERIIEESRTPFDAKARVIFARDTRPSGSRLVACLEGALKAAKTEYIDYKILTTPQLHYLVLCTNTLGTQYEYGEVSEQGYYKKMAAAFEQAMSGATPKGAVTVDCANGVGAPKLKELMKHLNGAIKINVINDKIEKAEVLNKDCGADYVKTKQMAPPSNKAAKLDRCASFDGDADRIVYYFTDSGNQFRLLDGDRIATLIASFIGDLARTCGLGEKLNVVVVQTAYANGASTKYIEQNLKLKAECTDTGVKHLHHVAQRYDVGVYFEANGHGTALFSANALKHIRRHQPESPAQLEALNTLRALTDLINQTVGDALSDLLLVEVILAHKEYTMEHWLATYTDLPNKLFAASVGEKNNWHTEPGTAERKLAKPPIQPKLDTIISQYRQGRAFVRASGTENKVRIYVEAESTGEVDSLMERVRHEVHLAG